jgi:hypothetical protein
LTEALPIEEVQKVKYCGKCLSKVDIEDLLKKLKLPVEPDPSECCGRDCNPCVYTRYDRNLEKYEDKMTEYQALLLEFED